MNLNPANRKVFLVLAAVLTFVGLVALIVEISMKVASVETRASAVSTPQPALLEGPLAPPKLLQGRINKVDFKTDALATPFFDQNDREITPQSLVGKGLVINLWATWCVPCVKEMPDLDQLAADLKGTGVEVLAISVDRKAVDKVPPFYAANGIKNLGVYYDHRSQLSKRMGVRGLPTTILIRANGQPLGQVSGIVQWSHPEVRSYLLRALGPTP